MADTRHVIFRQGNEHSVLAANELRELLKQWGKLTNEGIDELIREGALEYRPLIGEPTHVRPEFAGRFMEILKPVRLVVYGSPGSEVKNALAGFKPVYMQSVGVFRR